METFRLYTVWPGHYYKKRGGTQVDQGVNINTNMSNRTNTSTAFAVAESIRDVTSVFNERSITYNGSLQSLDIDSILRQKQEHIYDIYK